MLSGPAAVIWFFFSVGLFYLVGLAVAVVAVVGLVFRSGNRLTLNRIWFASGRNNKLPTALDWKSPKTSRFLGGIETSSAPCPTEKEVPSSWWQPLTSGSPRSFQRRDVVFKRWEAEKKKKKPRNRRLLGKWVDHLATWTNLLLTRRRKQKPKKKSW